MKKLSLLLLIVMLLAAACGTAATPVPNSATAEALAAAESHDEDHAEDETEGESDGEAVAVEATSTPIPPTNTPQPPTATPTEALPTEIPATPTTEATADPLVILISTLGDTANGETLFDTEFTTALGVWRCAQCHNVDSEEQLIGPGLLNLRDRAGDRVEGMTAERYVFNSIVAPGEYIVEGYPENVMPPNYAEILTEQEIYDLSAYVLSLGE